MAVLAVTALLASCSSFRPVYGGATGIGAAGDYAFDYASPVSRLDQVVYAELRLRLGPDLPGAGAYHVNISTSQTARAITRTAVTKPSTTNEATVTATIGVVDAAGKVVFTGTRKASALYTTSGQVLADTAALNEASERAARTVADSVRLAILGALAPR